MFKDITGYEGRYQINEYGMIKNQYGNYLAQCDAKITRPGNLPYKKVSLTNGEERKTYLVHRLVAQEFVPNDNPDVNTIVMHKDNDCHNNKASNLKWGTPKDNARQCAQEKRNYIPTEENITSYIYILYNPETNHTIFTDGTRGVANKIFYKQTMIKHLMEKPNCGHINRGPYKGYIIYRTNFMMIRDKYGNLLYTN